MSEQQHKYEVSTCYYQQATLELPMYLQIIIGLYFNVHCRELRETREAVIVILQTGLLAYLSTCAGSKYDFGSTRLQNLTNVGTNKVHQILFLVHDEGMTSFLVCCLHLEKTAFLTCFCWLLVEESVTIPFFPFFSCKDF